MGHLYRSKFNEMPSTSHKTQPTFTDLELLQRTTNFPCNLVAPSKLQVQVGWHEISLILRTQFCCILWICYMALPTWCMRGYNTFWYKGKKARTMLKKFTNTQNLVSWVCAPVVLYYHEFYIVLHQDIQFRFFPDLPSGRSLSVVELRP